VKSLPRSGGIGYSRPCLVAPRPAYQEIRTRGALDSLI
jgi:hypothetical protein